MTALPPKARNQRAVNGMSEICHPEDAMLKNLPSV
jgi:hypothetical protein